MDNKNLAKLIFDNVGGEKNINSVSHCATRLRFDLKDDSIANTDEIMSSGDVISVLNRGGQYQVVIGTKVASVYDELTQFTDKTEGYVDADDDIEDNKKTKFNVFTFISGIFGPLLPAFAGAGILRGFTLLATQIGILSTESSTYNILTIAAMSVFYFLPILLAYTTAKSLKANVIFAMVIGASLINPDLIAMMGETGNGTTVDFMGIPVVLMNYASTVLPIVISILVYSKLEKLLKRIIPEGGHLVFVPLFSFLIMIPFTLMTIGPVTVWISTKIADFINYLIESNRMLTGLLIGGGWNGLVSVGLHWAVNPIMIQNIATLGYDYIVPFTFATNFAMMGAAIGVWLKAKDKTYKKYALTTAITIAFSGITEPAIYGVAIPLKKPFLAALIGGAAGGAYIGAMGVTAQSFVFGGLTTLPTFVGGQGNNMLHAIIGLSICVVASAVLTYILGFEEQKNLQKTNI